MAKKKKIGDARVYACKFTIYCPDPKCGEAIIGPEGGISWVFVPKTVECQACGRVSRTAKTIRED